MSARSTAYLQKLRCFMNSSKYITEAIQAYIIPSCDAHQSEYIAPCDKRREFITGFTGSAGIAVVTTDKAALWTDGRYHLQATQELDENWILMKDGLPTTPSISCWLSKNLKSGSKVGVDPFLMPYNSWTILSKQLHVKDLFLVPVNSNLVDPIWEDQPKMPNSILKVLDIKYTGKTWQDKILEVRKSLKEKNACCLIVTDLAEIAWLLNVRGSDIEYNPVFFAYVVVAENDIHFFIDPQKITPEVEDHLQLTTNTITLHHYSTIQKFINDLVDKTGNKIWINNKSSFALLDSIPESQRVMELSPIQIMKAVKNSVEVDGMKLCHIRDGVALCQYFAWLDANIDKMDITEVSGATKLEEFRSEQEDFVGLSFATISSSGPNGAIMHYCPSEKTDRPITTSDLYLCDSGGQYKNGTTDVTRTWHFGTPTAFEKKCYTHVLKGHIALSIAVFPTNVKGNKLDVFARASLWNAGLDYMHGTGHGVGSYLNVHEGPIGIHFRDMPDDPGLLENMILTIEPGFYEDGYFGIRIENVVQIVKAKTEHHFKGITYLTFEPVTMHPIQTKMITKDLLTKIEIEWVNDYHERCLELLGPLLKEQGKQAAYEWLLKETKPI